MPAGHITYEAHADAIEGPPGHDSKRAWKAGAIILVEQNSRVAFEFSDRSVVMDKGRIVYDGASKTLRERA